MRRLWVPAALLLALAVLAGVHVAALGRFTHELDALLVRAEVRAAAEDWSGAEGLTRQALDLWDQHTFYLRVTLRHDDIDAVLCSFREALTWLEQEEGADYAAAAARLRVQLGLLAEGELPTLKNVL